MARISSQELLQRLKKGKMIPAMLLLGDEPYLRDACRAKIDREVCPGSCADVGRVAVFGGSRGETQSARSRHRRCRCFRSSRSSFSKMSRRSRSSGEKNRDAAVEQLRSVSRESSAVHGAGAGSNRSGSAHEAGEAFVDKTLVVEVGLGENIEQRLSTAVTLATALAARRKSGVRERRCRGLGGICRGDLMRLQTEIKKLATYVGDRKIIRRQDVVALVISEKTTTVWELADMLAARQQKKALEFLERILRDGEEPLQMLGALTWMYRKLIEASEVAEWPTVGRQRARWGCDPSRRNWRCTARARSAKPRLLEGLQALQRADSLLKGGADDTRAVMEFLMIELTDVGAAKAAAV